MHALLWVSLIAGAPADPDLPAASTTPAPAPALAPSPEPLPTAPGPRRDARVDPASRPNLGYRPIRAYKSPGAAAALSTLFPGAGHIYLGDHDTGRGFIVLGIAELGMIAATLADDWPPALTDVGFSPTADPGVLLALTLFQNTWTYSIFAAYRDARLHNQNLGYRLPVAEDGLADLLLAPVNPDVMLQPEVGLGLIAMVAIGLAVSHAVDESLSPRGPSLFERRRINFMGQQVDSGRGAVLGQLYYLGLFVPVGIGEEAFFRGFLQSSLSESLGPWGGWATASLVFGAAHVPNALLISDPGEQERYLGFAIPMITALGAYMGWVYMFNDYSLAEPVALHFWYDFILSVVSFALSPDSQPFAFRFGLPF